MDKGMMVWMIVAVSLIVLGGILFTVTMALHGWNFGEWSTTRFETNEHLVDQDFDDISIQSDTADITFLPSLDGKCRVVCVEETKVKHAVSVQNGVLTIGLNSEKKWYDYIGINFKSPTLTVYLPKSEYGDLVIKEDTGMVQIPGSVSFASMDITTSTGAVNNEASCSGDLTVKVSTGKIFMQSISAQNITLTASTGDVKLTDVTCQGLLQTKVTTGKTDLTDVSCNRFVSTGSTGDIILKNVTVKADMSVERNTGDVRLEACNTEKLVVHTTTGDVFLDACDPATFEITTDTGDVKGSFVTPKKFIARADTGRVSVPSGSEGFDSTINTDTGDIKIEFLS